MTFAVIDNFYYFDDSDSRSQHSCAATRNLFHLCSSHDDASVEQPGTRLSVPFLRNSASTARISHSDPYIIFRDFVLTRFATRSQCDAKGCNRYGEVEGKKLRKCARCLIAFYCSRECQTAHWRAAIHPHQAFCTIMQKVRQAADDGLPDRSVFCCMCRCGCLGRRPRLCCSSLVVHGLEKCP